MMKICKSLQKVKLNQGNNNSDENSNGDGRGQTGVATKTRSKTQKPSMYKVLLLNDDYTPMEFVVEILERFFSKKGEEAVKIITESCDKLLVNPNTEIYHYKIMEDK